MNKKVLLLLPLAFLMLFAGAAPAFAGFPTHGSFGQIITSVGLSGVGTTITKGNTEYGFNMADTDFIYAPLSFLGNSISSGDTLSWELNTVSFTGYGVMMTTDVYASGMVKGVGTFEFDGIGAFVYSGPSFGPVVVGGVSVTVTPGTYFGLLMSGSAVKHGVSASLKDYMTYEPWTGVDILAGPLAGVGLVVNTVNYNFA